MLMAWCAATSRAAVPDAVLTEDAESDQHYLLGDWMGVRTSLWEHGVKPKFLLISDAYGNPYGGKEQSFTSYSMFCADLKLDTEKLVNLPGGEFHVAFTVNIGNQLSQGVVGNVFPIQSSDVAPPGPRLTDLSYTQSLFDNKVSLRGRTRFHRQPLRRGIRRFCVFPLLDLGGFQRHSLRHLLQLARGFRLSRHHMGRTGQGSAGRTILRHGRPLQWRPRGWTGGPLRFGFHLRWSALRHRRDRVAPQPSGDRGFARFNPAPMSGSMTRRHDSGTISSQSQALMADFGVAPRIF